MWQLNNQVVALVVFLMLMPVAVLAAPDLHYTVDRLHLKIHVNADGTSVTERIEETTLLTETGIDWFGEEKVSFSGSRETAEVLEAFTWLADGTKVPVENRAIRLVADDSAGQEGAYTDGKAYMVIFPQLSLGARTHLHTRVEEHTPLFAGEYHNTWQFSLGVYRGDVLIELSHDPAIDLMIETSAPSSENSAITIPAVNVTRLDAVSTGAPLVRYRLTFANPHPIDLDDNVIDGLDVSPYLRVSSLPDMLALGKRYQDRSQVAESVTPTVQALADQITAGITDKKAQAHAIYDWVTREIRYVAIFLGDGGVVPNLGDDIIRNRYGDCKDHNTLLIALLSAKGIKAESALVNSGYTYKLPRLGDVSPMNHVITYLPQWDLYVDSTNRYAPFGVLGSSVVDKPTVLTRSLAFGRTPNSPALDNRIESVVAMRIDGQGFIEGESQTVRVGSPAISVRSYLVNYFGGYKRSLIEAQLRRFGYVGFGEYVFDSLDDLRDPVSFGSTFSINPVTNMPGAGAMTVPVGLAPGRIAALAWFTPHAEYDLPFYCRSYSHQDRYSIVFPEAVKVTRLPPDQWFADGGHLYYASYRQDGQTIFVERELMVDRPSAVCQPGDEKPFNEMLSVIQRDLRGQIFYE